MLAVVICSHFENVADHNSVAACVWEIVENDGQVPNPDFDELKNGKSYSTILTLLKSLVRLDNKWKKDVYEKFITTVWPYCSIKEYTDSLKIQKFIIYRGFETNLGILTMNLYQNIDSFIDCVHWFQLLMIPFC